MRNRLRRFAPLAEEVKEHAPDLPSVFLRKAKALGGKVELLVCVLFLRVGVAHVFVDVVHVCAAVVAVEGTAESGTVDELAEVLV